MQRRIRRRVVAPGRAYVIAEGGSNHGGRLSTALKITEQAAKAGADAIKWQLFQWDDISQVGPLLDPKLQLPPEWLPQLRDAAHDRGLAFMCTPFAPWAVEALDPFVDAWKIGSFESGYRELWADIKHCQRGRVIFASLGRVPDSQMGPLFRTHTKDNVIFMHCVSEYPTPAGAWGLNRLRRLLHRRTTIGYSSHSDCWADVLAAVAIGAIAIEKHIRLNEDEQPESPDNADHALCPMDFAAMVQDIRAVSRGFTGKRHLLADPGYGRINRGLDDARS